MLEASDITIGKNNLAHIEKDIAILANEIQGALADEETRVLAMLNHSSSSRAFLNLAVNLTYSVTMDRILNYRAGTDGILNTADDQTFTSIAQLEALPLNLNSTAVSRIKSHARIWSPTQSKQIVALLAYLNNSSTTAAQVAANADISLSRAENIINQRNGTDGLVGTADDNLFINIHDVDIVEAIGPIALKRLLDYAQRELL